MNQVEVPVTAWVELPAAGERPAGRFIFRRPLDCWSASALDEVRHSLERVEEYQRQGCYVVGWVGYEAAPAFDRAMKTPPAGEIPLCWFAAFREYDSSLGDAQRKPTRPTVSLGISESDYLARVRRSLEHIAVGDIYQVNYTVRSGVDNLGDPLALFCDRIRAVPVPHAAFIDAGEWQIISLSPELFLRRGGNVIESRPMKGTAARRPSWDEDEAARLALEQSGKERAENTMIVDLVRNDLGRVCRSGTVHVPELCTASRFPTVHQMTSLVRGELRAGATLFDIFEALFPPGSVTGAPKIRAMEIIAELEPEPRGIYCGTIGLFFPGGDFECNVAIRTVEIQRRKSKTQGTADELSIVHRSWLGLGSGIVADSDPQAEWAETLLKGRFLTQEPPPEFSLIETLAWIPDEGFRNLDRHLRRLRNSAAYFGWTRSKSKIQNPESKSDVQKVRLIFSRGGALQMEFAPLDAWPSGGIRLYIYHEECVDPENVLLYYKTTVRGIYERAMAAARRMGAEDAVLVNSRGEITETTRANLLVKLNGEWLTPALTCGLLPGVWRELQLETGRCREAVVSVEDFSRADEIIVGNSARGEGGAGVL